MKRKNFLLKKSERLKKIIKQVNNIKDEIKIVKRLKS